MEANASTINLRDRIALMIIPKINEFEKCEAGQTTFIDRIELTRRVVGSDRLIVRDTVNVIMYGLGYQRGNCSDGTIYYWKHKI